MDSFWMDIMYILNAHARAASTTSGLKCMHRMPRELHLLLRHGNMGMRWDLTGSGALDIS